MRSSGRMVRSADEQRTYEEMGKPESEITHRVEAVDFAEQKRALAKLHQTWWPHVFIDCSCFFASSARS